MTMPKGWNNNSNNDKNDDNKDANKNNEKPDPVLSIDDFISSLVDQDDNDVEVLGLKEFQEFLKDKIQGKDVKFVHVAPKNNNNNNNTNPPPKDLDSLRTEAITDI